MDSNRNFAIYAKNKSKHFCAGIYKLTYLMSKYTQSFLSMDVGYFLPFGVWTTVIRICDKFISMDLVSHTFFYKSRKGWRVVFNDQTGPLLVA